jgi:hypothetical protein
MRTGILVLLTALALPGCDSDNLPELGDIVLVVTGDAAQTPADMALNSRLLSLEYDTRVVDEPSMTAEDYDDEEVGYIVISSSVRSSAPLSSLSDTPRPVLVTQVWVADDFGISASDAKITELNPATGPDVDLGTWQIVDDGHPAAGSASKGPVAMWEVDQSTVVPMIDAPESATVIAEFNEGNATLVVYDRGDELGNGEDAVQKRALFPVDPRAPIRLTESAWALFDATVAWAF